MDRDPITTASIWNPAMVPALLGHVAAFVAAARPHSSHSPSNPSHPFRSYTTKGAWLRVGTTRSPSPRATSSFCGGVVPVGPPPQPRLGSTVGGSMSCVDVSSTPSFHGLVLQAVAWAHRFLLRLFAHVIHAPAKNPLKRTPFPRPGCPLLSSGSHTVSGVVDSPTPVPIAALSHRGITAIARGQGKG